MPNYYLVTTDQTAGVLDQLSTSAGGSQNSSTGWVTGTNASPNYALYYPNTLRARTVFSSTEPSAFSGYGFVYPVSNLRGTYAAGNWVLNYRVMGFNSLTITGYLKMRLWKSTSVDGTGAVEITSGWQSSSLMSFTSNGQLISGTITASCPAVPMMDEYIFLELEWSCGASGGNTSATVNLLIHTSSDYLQSPTLYTSFGKVLVSNVTYDIRAAYVLVGNAVKPIGNMYTLVGSAVKTIGST